MRPLWRWRETAHASSCLDTKHTEDDDWVEDWKTPPAINIDHIWLRNDGIFLLWTSTRWTKEDKTILQREFFVLKMNPPFFQTGGLSVYGLFSFFTGPDDLFPVFGTNDFGLYTDRYLVQFTGPVGPVLTTMIPSTIWVNRCTLWVLGTCMNFLYQW